MPDLDSADLYSRLGVSRSASAEEIKRAYLALVRQYTPERAPEAFKRIREAYETLNNSETRRQYDLRPDPRVANLLSQASDAMKSREYQVAEQAYKKVLLASPGLTWVRNLLGLCFLYQHRADEAIAQYERLLRESRADASIHANAGQAYWMAKRFDEAEREFRAARSASDDKNFEYGLSLIQVIVDRGEPERADKVALAESDVAPPGSVAALEYSAKRIELALLLGRTHTIPSLLLRIKESVSTEDQRRYAALALGKMAGRLIAGEAFESAEQVARVAKALQPNDPNYDGLEVASRLLHENDFDGVARLLNTHVSFASGAWLEGLKPVVQEFCATHAAFKGMIPVTAAPSLFRVNGIGTTILGHRDDDPLTGTHVVTQYFTFLFVPLFPVASYRVRAAPSGGWHFLGKVPLAQSQKTYRRVFLAVAVISFLFWVANQDTSSSYRASSTPSSNRSSDVSVPPTSAPSTTRRTAVAVYDGEAVNATYSSIRSNIRLTIYSWEEMPNGYLTVFPPLGGSGPLYLEARGDSIRFATVSAVGDTIIWFGRRVGDGAAGSYRIIGGQYKSQYGTWKASLTNGTPIPTRLNPW
jgi:curved DNA-binding protein CbpA